MMPNKNWKNGNRKKTRRAPKTQKHENRRRGKGGRRERQEAKT